MRVAAFFLFLIFGFNCSSCSSEPDNPPVLRVHDTLVNGKKYRLFIPEYGKIHFTTERPLPTTDSVFLSVPAAYTSLGTMGVDGIYMVKGKVFQNDAINRTLGGAAIISENGIRLIESGYGEIFSDYWIDSLKNAGASFFQQTICVVDGKAENFRDKKHFQRRGLIRFKDGTAAILESEDAILLHVFAEDAESLGADALLNLDMGAWDEGWYKDPESGKTIVLGKDRSQTARQTSWLIISEGN